MATKLKLKLLRNLGTQIVTTKKNKKNSNCDKLNGDKT